MLGFDTCDVMQCSKKGSADCIHSKSTSGPELFIQTGGWGDAHWSVPAEGGVKADV